MGEVERDPVLRGSYDFPDADFVRGIEIGKGWTDDCAVRFFDNASACIWKRKEINIY